MNDDTTLLKEYLSESEQLIDMLLSDLDTLSSQGSGDKPAKPAASVVNRVFRTVHSLKGLSGMMGLVEVQALTHEFEDLLDDLRLGRLVLDRNAANLLQEAGGSLAGLFVGAAHGSAGEDDFRRCQELISAIAVRPLERRKEEDRVAELLGLSERERALLTEFEQHRIKVNIDVGRQFYSVAARFPIAELDSKYRSLTAKLDGVGELITTLPGKESDANIAALKFLFATDLKEAELRAQVESPELKLERVGRSAWRRAGEALKSVGRIQSLPGWSSRAGEARRKSGGPVTEPQTSGRDNETEGALSSAVLPASFEDETLRPLLPSVRVDLSEIDDVSSLAHELSLEASGLAILADHFMTRAGCSPRERFDLKLTARRIEREFLELEERLVELRMVSLAQTFDRAARLARRLARQLGKSVTVELLGRSTQLDKLIVDRLADTIHHVLRNAVDHGIETPDVRRIAGKPGRGLIRIDATLEGTRAVIAISDDGRGIDLDKVRARGVEIGAIAPDDELPEEETLRLIFRPGFSTVSEVSRVSGRGVGLDAVERAMVELGGEIRVSSQLGRGCRFELAAPTTLQLISAFVVSAGGWLYAVNVGQIVELVRLSTEDFDGGFPCPQNGGGFSRVRWRDTTIPIVSLDWLLGVTPVEERSDESGSAAAQKRGLNGNGTERIPALITRVSDRPVAVAVDGFEGQREIIVKSLGSIAPRIRGVVGAVDLERGEVALVLDLAGLISLSRGVRSNG
ncbi:MAG TPA: ATP-binding protein [Blastocatellia bacterium]|nr:ATP-binding protein [Blastocatellia bacterium]